MQSYNLQIKIVFISFFLDAFFSLTWITELTWASSIMLNSNGRSETLSQYWGKALNLSSLSVTLIVVFYFCLLSGIRNFLPVLVYWRLLSGMNVIACYTFFCIDWSDYMVFLFYWFKLYWLVILKIKLILNSRDKFHLFIS